MALMSCWPASAETNCHALTRIGEDYHLVSRAGQLIHRYTGDGTPRPDRLVFPAVSPDGTRMAYISDEPGQEGQVLVADAAGSVGRFRLLAPAGDSNGAPGILEMEWIDDSLLQVDRHLNPRAGLIDRYRIPVKTSPDVMELMPVLDRSVAVHCAIDPRTRAAACIHESVVSIGSEMVYQRSWRDGLQPVETLVIPLGAEAAPAGTHVRIKPLRVEDGRAVLAVTYGGGTTTTGLGPGEALEVSDDDIRYALMVGAIGEGVRVQVFTDGRAPWEELLESVVAWRDDGGQLAVIENLPSGKQLSLLQRVGASEPPVWHSVAKVALPVEQSVRQMRFVSPFRLFVATEGAAFLFPFQARLSGRRWKLVLGPALVLPETIVVQKKALPPQTSRVLGWTCKGS